MCRKLSLISKAAFVVEMRMFMGSDDEESVVFSISSIRLFIEFPFVIRDDNTVEETVKSIKVNGVIMPAIVRNNERDEVIIIMVDSNSQVENNLLNKIKSIYNKVESNIVDVEESRA